MARALRAEYKEAIRYAKNGAGPRPTGETMAKYHEGKFREEANAATRKAGHGAIRYEHVTIIELRRSYAFEDYVSRGRRGRREHT